MISRSYKCSFLSDIVLNADTATEGNQQTLDYIPGSCFLGIAATQYNKVSDAYKIFHSGDVSFGDAHIALGNKRSLKQPAAWFYEKNDTEHSKIYLYHYLADVIERVKNDFTVNAPGGAQFQPKQIRSGYFIEKKKVNAKTVFSIKSAYNSEEMRSADGQLYGYEALRRGTTWIFSIRAKDEELLKEVEGLILGEHSIGRSKTAQFGRVLIEPVSPEEWVKSIATEGSENIVYFESNASFITDEGIPTLNPTVEMLGFSGGKILWEKSQILTRKFAPWNSKRKTRDADRMIISKGSVIVVKGGDFNQSVLNEGVGIYRNEGFGRILLNPHFLVGDKESACMESPPSEETEIELKLTSVKDASDKDKVLLNWLNKQEKDSTAITRIIEKTNTFIDRNGRRFKSISPSQWGSIRERATRKSNYADMMNELFRANTYRGEGMDRRMIETGGYLMHGKMEKNWKKLTPLLKGEIEDIKNELGEANARKFLINLCSEMAKHVAK